MKIKINTGLIATNGDGKPSFRPPIPAGWCRPLAPSSSEDTSSIKFVNGNILQSDRTMSSGNGCAVEGMDADVAAPEAQETPLESSSNGFHEAVASPKENELTPSSNQDAEETSELERNASAEPASYDQHSGLHMHSNLSPSSSLAITSAVASTHSTSSIDAVAPLEGGTSALPVSESTPSPNENEDSNVDVETEEHFAPLVGSNGGDGSTTSAMAPVDEAGEEMAESRLREPVVTMSSAKSDDYVTSNDTSHIADTKTQDEESALSDAQFIERQVVDSFLNQGGPPEISQTSTPQSFERPEDQHNGILAPPIAPSINSPLAMSDTAVTDSGIGDTTPSSTGGDSGSSTQQPEKIMDALSMTIASVAAGEGEPPEYISKFVPDLAKSKPITAHRHSQPQQPSNKHKKSRADRPMSASARLPVISSLLAPTSIASHQSNVLPGIQHIAPSGRGSNSPNTVLPSVAHFLGPAKSPPTGFNQQQPQHSTTSELLPAMGPETEDPGQYQNSAAGGGANANVAGASSLSSGKSNKANRKPVTPAGLRLSMAASEELPDPLPMPQYSDKVIRAKQLGTVAFDRPTVLRETVQFFLQYKHYWSSHDYDRISNQVIELFPEFKDNSDTPGVPANKRIRTDLSMYARNFRRREVSQRKKEGGSTPSSADLNKSDPGVGSSSEVVPSPGDTKSFLHTSPSLSQQLPQLPAGASSATTAAAAAAVVAGTGANPTDFCNELLTAASIIESQNTSAGTKNGHLGGQISHNQHKVKMSERDPGGLGGQATHKQAGGLQQDSSNSAPLAADGSVGNSHGYHTQQQQQQQQRGLSNAGTQEEGDNQPIHFVYDKDTVPAAASRDANAAWQMYSDQMAQAMATGNSGGGLDYGMPEDVSSVSTSSSSIASSIATTVAATDRLSAMAMWRSTTLPDPLPTPHYSDSVTRARESGNTMSARPKIIRETTQFFLALKLWWTAPDYERIAELVLKNFPALVSLQAIKKDLGTCARNMRRRLPASKYKPSSSQVQKSAAWAPGSTSGGGNNAAAASGTGMEAVQQGVDAGTAGAQANPAEYMKALLAAQSMNLSELGMSQRNLGELAVLAGIKQRIEQHPGEAGDLERQYLAQCTTEEQRQALVASGAFGNDSTAMAALSAFYGQLGVDIGSAAKRVSDYPPTSSSTSVGVSGGGHDSVGGGLGEVLVVPNKRQRRISQAEVEKRLREAELNHVTQQGQHHPHHHQQQQLQHHMELMPKSSHQGGLAVSISDKHLVKREPTSPTGVEGLKNRQQQQQHNHHLQQHHQQQQHQQQQHHHQQLTVPSPINMSNFAVSSANSMGPASIPSSSSTLVAHEQAYWDAQTANMALMGLSTSVAPLMATQAHSQAQVQHLAGHPHPGLSSSHSASHEVPMNLTYHEADKTGSPSSQSSHPHHRQLTESPSVADPLPDTAGLAAQVEVTTSSTKSPRRRTSSPRAGSQQGDPSLSQRDQVWFPHGQGFKKENQEVVCLPEPLPVPVYSQKIAAAREEGSSMRHRSEIIRETARFFLGLKYWWSSADYTRISELVVQQFPDLKDDSTGDGMNNYRRIQRDLSMCARNLRRSKKPRKMRELSSSDLANSMMVSGENNQQQHHHQGVTGETRKRLTRPKGTLYGAAAERKAKRQAGASSARAKKSKTQQAGQQATPLESSCLPIPVVNASVASESAAAGVNEDMTAAAALMQQQFMQQPPVSSAYPHPQHPSAHLLPTTHLLPSLHTHPALHEQHLQQMNPSLLQQQQEGASITVEDAHSVKRLVKEEPAGPDSLDHSHSSIKANMVTPVQRTLSPALGLDADGQSSATAELAKQRVLRDMETGVISREDTDKLSQAQVQPASTLKVYVDPDHGSDLQERFSTLWRKGKFFDASLGVANKKLHVHKLVLLAMSPYLQETFKNADPRSQLEVNLPSDTTYETAKAFLKYIYEGILEVDTSSVRSLHKIAFMLQMNKLAQYCQNFAQQLQEEAEQALQRLGDTNTMSDLQRATARYVTEEHMQFKAGYLADAQQSEAGVAQPHFLHQDALTQHRALVTASSPTSSHQHQQQQQQHHQQQNTGSSSTLLLSSGSSASAQDLATHHLIQAALVRHQAGSPTNTAVPASSSIYQQQHEVLSAVGGVPASDNNSTLLQRLTSPALAAYWQAHSLGELMSRGGVTSDPSNQTSASELAAIAAAASAATTSSSSLSSEDHRHLVKGGRGGGLHPHPHHHHQQLQHQQHKESQHWVQHTDADAGHHQGSMLPETCLPGDLGRGNS